MGNQMFQYAFGLQAARKLGVDLAIDLSLLLDRARGADHVYRDYDLTIFNVPHRYLVAPSLLKILYFPKSAKICKMTRKWLSLGKNYVREPHFHVSESILSQPTDETIYEGWWQSERYFSDISEEIKAIFTFVQPVLPISQPLLTAIQETNSVCLNVRRTDFLKVGDLNTTNQAYFLQAADKIAEQVHHPHFFIFSDDVAWCRENLPLPYPTTIVDHQHKGEKFGNYMQLMKACKHFIIPNSSFAWWAVWLNDQPHKTVIAPKNWFNNTTYDTSDLVPKDWLRL